MRRGFTCWDCPEASAGVNAPFAHQDPAFMLTDHPHNLAKHCTRSAEYADACMSHHDRMLAA